MNITKIIKKLFVNDHSNNHNLFIKINQTEDIKTYKELIKQLEINIKANHVLCIDGVFIYNYNNHEATKELKNNFENRNYLVQLVNNHPYIQNKRFNQQYKLSNNYYEIMKKRKDFDVVDFFKNILSHAKGNIHYGIDIKHKTINISHNADKGTVNVKFDYHVKSMDKNFSNRINNYLENNYKNILKNNFRLIE